MSTILYDEGTSGDTAHDATGGSVRHPTLNFPGAIIGRLNNFVDPIFGLSADHDYYEFLLGTGPGQIAPGSFLTVTFTPGANWNSSTGQVLVTFRIDSDINLHNTTYYLGSTGTAIKHDNVTPNGPLTVTFQVPTDIPDPNNHVNPTTIHLPTNGTYGIEFEIFGYADGTFATVAPLDYTLTFGGPPAPSNQFNGHTYAFISFNGTPQNWSQARDAAAAMGGYLATITSQGENDFILNNVLAGHLPQGGPAVFIGASDAAHEGVWQWVTGPDAGTTFWNGAVNGSAVSGQYANWQPGNPNNATINVDGSENFAVMAGDGKWVDVPSVRDTFSTVGFVVEFSNPSSSTVSPAKIQNDYFAITRTALPLDQATPIANSMTETQYVNGLLVLVANTTIPAVAVEATMYGVTGTSAEITALVVNFLPAQIANATSHGLNPQVYACEALGLVFAFGNETGSTAFANNFGPSNSTMPNSTVGDAAFATAASNTIFGAASTVNLVSVMQNFVANWKAFYMAHGVPGFANASAAQIDLAARGAAWGDMVGVALANNLGLLDGQAINFLDDAAQGTAIYGASLIGQPAHQPFG